jgi:hypothetical protein
MTRRLKRITKAREDSPDDDETVGYGRPPKSGQFKPGQSGNPNGRPKGVRNLATNVKRVLSRQITVMERGRKTSMSAAEAILHKYLELAIKGNVKAGAFLLNLLEQLQPGEANEDKQDVLGERDQQIMQNFFQQFGPPAQKGTSK